MVIHTLNQLGNRIIEAGNVVTVSAFFFAVALLCVAFVEYHRRIKND